VRVELYADRLNNGTPFRQEMKRGRQTEAAGFIFATQVTAERPSTDYTVRAIPHFRGAAVPLEAPQNSPAALVTKTPERPLPDYLKAVSDRAGVRVGSVLPMGTSQQDNGGNFAFFSRHATRVRLELFDSPADQTPSRQIELDSARNRTGDVWHIWVEGIRPGQLYGYRVDGPYSPSEGQRFNFASLLLDPFATAISRAADWDFGKTLGYNPSAPERDLSRSKVDDAGAMPKCVFTQEHFDWTRRPAAQTSVGQYGYL